VLLRGPPQAGRGNLNRYVLDCFVVYAPRNDDSSNNERQSTRPDELVEKIMQTMNDNELRLRVAKMGYKTVVTKFSEKSNMETLTSIYEELLSH